MPTDTAELLRIAQHAARSAADLLQERRPPGVLEITATKSSATDIVTEMDQAAEQLIVEQIRAARPGDGFLGEEGAADEGSSGVTWVIDPIDGTVNYLYGIPAYAVSIGVRIGRNMVAGVVCNPVTGEMWTARRGFGAELDGRPIRVNPVSELAMALVATGFGYQASRRARQAEILRAVLPLVRDIRRFGAASLDLCALACGRVDAYYERGLKPWDLAAGGLIATEAGARVEGLGGRPAGEDLVIAAPPGIFGRLEALLAEQSADRD
ncbi:MAG: inositol monophosphatase family protein [Sporichthyaceae bacterium]